MATNAESSNRRIVPRWRSYREAVKTGEIDPERTGAGSPFSGENFLHEREHEWLANKELLYATDLVCAAYSIGHSAIANEAAYYILGHPGASELSKRISRALLNLPEPATTPDSGKNLNPDNLTSKIRSEIAGLKRRRRIEPRNAFVWLDCARLYTFLGLNVPAKKAIEIALALAPYDRFIGRSACRFFLHLGEPDRALKILRSNERTNCDPWLMAAELAVSSVTGKSPKSYKLAKSLLASKRIFPFHQSELASALASIEMWDGNSKRARNLFLQALEQPTENALAQCVWAAKQVGLNPIAADKAKLDNAFEASCWSMFQAQNWKASLDFARRWCSDEAFSSRPFQFSSALAGSLLNDPAEAERLAREGLRTNPDHPGLLNNVAFCLVSQGRITEACEIIQAIDLAKCHDASLVCLLATSGLVEYRRGNHLEGKILYERAMTTAFEHKLTALRLRAMLYFAREECFIKSPDSDTLLQRSMDEAKKSKDSALIALSFQIKSEIQTSKLAPAHQP